VSDVLIASAGRIDQVCKVLELRGASDLSGAAQIRAAALESAAMLLEKLDELLAVIELTDPLGIEFARVRRRLQEAVEA
jgi:hypothetical protein